MAVVVAVAVALIVLTANRLIEVYNDEDAGVLFVHLPQEVLRDDTSARSAARPARVMIAETAAREAVLGGCSGM